MYRSASTLQFQITSRLVQEFGLGQSIGWIDAQRFPELRQSYASDAGLKVIKVHTCTEAIAQEFAQKQAIGSYTFRDLRDVYASSLRQRQKTFADLWQSGFIEQCLDNYARWTTLSNMLISRYEQIILNLANEVKRIGNHLGMTLTPDQCQQLANDYQVEPQRQRIETFKAKLAQTSPYLQSENNEVV